MQAQLDELILQLGDTLKCGGTLLCLALQMLFDGGDGTALGFDLLGEARIFSRALLDAAAPGVDLKIETLNGGLQLVQPRGHGRLLTLDGLQRALFQRQRSPEFVETFAGFEFAAQESLHFQLQFSLMDTGRFDLFLSDGGLFLLPSDLSLGGLDAVGYLGLIPLDTFQFGRGLLKRTLHDRKLAGECGEAFTDALTLLAQGDLFGLHFLKLMAELLHSFLFFQKLKFKTLQLHTQRAHFSFTAEHGCSFLLGRPAMDDTIGGNELALQCSDGHIMKLALQTHGRVQILDDQNVVQKAVSQLLYSGLCPHLIDRPGNAALGHQLAIRHRAHGGEIVRKQCSLAKLLVCKAIKNLGCQFTVSQQDGLKMVAQCSLNGGNELRLHLDGGSQKTSDAHRENFRIVETTKHLLRPLGQALPFLQKLLDDFNA